MNAQRPARSLPPPGLCKGLGLCALAGLAGCSLFSQPATKPIIEDHAQNQLNTFAIQSSRRMMIVKSNINHQGDKGVKALDDDGLLKDKAVVLCAEAAPDVTDDILSSLSAAASGAGPSAGDAKAAQLGVSLAQALATTGQILFKRTQSLQLYRDSAYHLCQAKINGFIDNDQFRERLDHAQAQAAALLQLELPLMYAAQAAGAGSGGTAPKAKPTVTIDKDGKVTFSSDAMSVTVDRPTLPPLPAASAPK